MSYDIYVWEIGMTDSCYCVNNLKTSRDIRMSILFINFLYNFLKFVLDWYGIPGCLQHLGVVEVCFYTLGRYIGSEINNKSFILKKVNYV